MSGPEPHSPETPSPRNADHSAAPGPGRIGPYRLLSTLGEGGMGIVYLAEQQAPIRRRVALKVIRQGMETEDVTARFEAERQALARMSHPGIARIYDAGTTADGRPYFAMEHVPGKPITQSCDEQRLDLDGRLELLLLVCEALEHAHRRGIVHRDLKPSNVLVSRSDGRHVVKIIDFGVARATNQRLTERTLYTELGRAVGTPAYMSPEQAGQAEKGERRTGEIDPRSDVYSLGVLLYELLVGETPLDPEVLSRSAYDEILRQVREEDPPTPSTRWSRLSDERMSHLAELRGTDPRSCASRLRGDLDWIAMRAIEKDPARRYDSAKALGEDTRRHREGRAVLAGPPGRIHRLRKLVRRHRLPVVALGAVLLVLTAGLVASLLLWAASARSARLALGNERAAAARAEENTVLADLQRIEEYQSEAEDLWPDSAARVEEVDRWLEKARRLISRLPDMSVRSRSWRRAATVPRERRSGGS